MRHSPAAWCKTEDVRVLYTLRENGQVALSSLMMKPDRAFRCLGRGEKLFDRVKDDLEL